MTRKAIDNRKTVLVVGMGTSPAVMTETLGEGEDGYMA